MQWAFPGKSHSIGPKHVRLLPISTVRVRVRPHSDDPETWSETIAATPPCKAFLENGDLPGLITSVLHLPDTDLEAEALSYLAAVQPDLSLDVADRAAIEFGSEYRDAAESAGRKSPYSRAGLIDKAGRRYWLFLIGGCWGRISAVRT
jgi:hypothetical protein